MVEQEVWTERLDHLGMVAGVCFEMGLIEEIDRAIGGQDRQVTVGQVTQAMVLNALGFVGRALYLTPEFFANKPVEVLIGEGVKAEDLNDDRLGRALDALYERGVTEVFAKVAGRALEVYGIETRYRHLDSTSFSVYGEYETQAEPEAQEPAEPVAIEICRGHSKDHRGDLKQAVLQLICTHQAAIPMWLEALSGNSQDKTSFRKTVSEYVKQMKEGEEPFFVMDSAGYTEDNLKAWSEQIKWISRVPGTITAAQQVEEAVERDQMEPIEEGYWAAEVGSWYAGVKQRWVVVYSQAAFEREQKGLAKKVKKAGEKAGKQWKKLRGQEWHSREDAEQAVERGCKGWRWHRVEGRLEAVPHYDGPGRPRADQEPEWIGWRVQGEVVEDQEAIGQACRRLGKFVLATNEREAETLSAAEILRAYKQQGGSVERGFRFLKDPLFFASGLYLQKPERIMATLMIMGLALLVYSLAEHKLRQALKQHDETVPDQKGKPTQRPTLRRVFQVFEGIDIIVQPGPQGLRRQVTNLRPVHHQILRLLGPHAQHCYLLAPDQQAGTAAHSPSQAELKNAFSDTG